MKKLLVLMLLSFNLMASPLPDIKLTPGESRQVTLQELCTTSTKLVRNVPDSVKKQVFKKYGLTGNNTGFCYNPLANRSYDQGCEVDHDESLELGGSNGINNLGLQKYFGNCNAHDKDKVENKLHAMICKPNPEITLIQAQTMIVQDWEGVYNKYVDPKGCNRDNTK